MLLNIFILTITILLGDVIEWNHSFEIDEYTEPVVFEFHEHLMYDWLCLFYNEKEVCQFKNWSKVKKKNFNERKVNFIIFVMKEDNMDKYQTHSFYNMMRYYNAMGFTIVSIIAKKIDESDDIVSLFSTDIFLFSERLYHPILPNKPFKICFNSYFNIKNPVQLEFNDKAIIHLHIDSKSPVFNEIKLLARSKFDIFEGSLENNKSFIRVSENKTSKGQKIEIDHLDLVDTHLVLYKAAHFITPTPNKIKNVKDNEYSWLYLSKHFVYRFASTVIVIVHEYHEQYLTSVLADELENLKNYQAVEILQVSKLNFKSKVFEICHEIPEPFYKSALYIYVFSHILKECKYIKDNGRNYYLDNHLVYALTFFIKRVEAKRKALIDLRLNTMCSDKANHKLGECFQTNGEKEILKDLEFNNGIPLKFLMRQRRHIVITLFYEGINPQTLSLIGLQNIWSKVYRTTYLHYFQMYDLSDIQSISIDCVRNNTICKKNKIVRYPTLKFNLDNKQINYDGNMESPTAIIRFIINHFNNPMDHSVWSTDTTEFIDAVQLYYDNILIIKNDPSTEQNEQLDIIKEAAACNLLIVTFKFYENPPFFDKYNIKPNEIHENMGIWLNLKLETKFIVDLTIPKEKLERKIQILDKKLIREITYYRLKQMINNDIPVLIIFYDKVEHHLTEVIEIFQKKFDALISLNSANLNSNPYKVRLFDQFGCSHVPCYVLYYPNDKFHTLSQTYVDLKKLFRWVMTKLSKEITIPKPLHLKFCSSNSSNTHVYFKHFDFYKMDWFEREKFTSRDEFNEKYA